MASRTPVVFIHGLWLPPSSWERWERVFEEARADPEHFACKTVRPAAVPAPGAPLLQA